MGIVNRYENIGKKAKFYTFSEYNNEVASRLIYNTNSTEFSFLCCTLIDYTDLVKKLEHYENITCNLRSKGYDEYYTGALIQTLGLETEGKFFCKKDISIFRDEEIDDVNYGYWLAKETGKLDIGQSVVIKDKMIMAVEAIEGTDVCIKRGAKLAKENAVVVKVAKPKQDRRFDIPAIGMRTLKTMHHKNAALIAVEANQTIIVDQEKVIKYADDHDIVIMAV